MIRALSPSVIRIKYLTKKSVLQAEYVNPRSRSGRLSHYWRTRKQDNESPLASQLLFLNSCTDLHMESIFPWASIKQHSIIFFFFHKQHKKWLYKLVFIYSWHWKRVTMWQSQRRSIVRALRGRVLHVLYLLKKTRIISTLCPRFIFVH